MKKLFTLIFSLITIAASAQDYWQENFEAPVDGYRRFFYSDTVNYHNNIWQVGPPQKTVFDSAYSAPNVIITDTIRTYPARDTSVMYVYLQSMTWSAYSNFSFVYKLDMDSQTVARVEVSGDQGLNWINVITQDTTYLFAWGSGKPRLDTSELSWQSFNIDMSRWASAVSGGTDTFPHYVTSDTIIVRFTFISGSDTAVHKDGWMMDNFMYQAGIMEGAVHTVDNTSGLMAYPNPSSGDFYLSYKGGLLDEAAITIYGLNGMKVEALQMPAERILHLSALPVGVYFLRFTNVDGSAIVKKIVKT